MNKHLKNVVVAAIVAALLPGCVSNRDTPEVLTAAWRACKHLGGAEYDECYKREIDRLEVSSVDWSAVGNAALIVGAVVLTVGAAAAISQSHSSPPPSPPPVRTNCTSHRGLGGYSVETNCTTR